MQNNALRVTIAADSFLSPDQTPELPYQLSFVPHDDCHALVRSLRNAEALVTRRVDITASLLEKAPSLRLIQQVGVGVDRIDIAAAARHGVIVANTAGAPTNAVVEHTFLLMLAALRGFPRQIEAMRADRWSHTAEWEGREIAGSRLGVLGFGQVGQGIARRALVFGADVIVTTRSVPHDADPRIRFVDLPTLLKESDIVVLTPALTPETRGLIGSTQLAQMKRDAFLINVSRGAVVDEAALVAALQQGALAGAGLDTFECEPLPTDSPLRNLPNVVATPHSAGASRQSRQRIWARIIDNLDRLANGRPLLATVSV